MKRIKYALVAALMSLGLVAHQAVPASAGTCGIAGATVASWGCGRVVQLSGYATIIVQDTLTDGYCVRAKAYTTGGTFLANGPQSCGAIVQQNNVPSNSSYTWRLVRDNGNYITMQWGVPA